MSSSSAAWISGSSSTIKTRCVWEPMVQCDSWNTNRKCATRPRAKSHGVPRCRANGDRKHRYIFTDGCTGACITSRTFRMLEPSAMLARLDAATRDSHAELDAYWLDLLAQGVTADRYREQLMRVYGIEAPLESALAYTPNFVVADRRDLTRSGQIGQDLIALGMRPAAATRLPQCMDIA